MLKSFTRALLIIPICFWGSCISTSNFEQSFRETQHNNAGFLNVTKVVDGDTFWVDNGTEKGMKIRLIGIDAPESRNAFNKRVGYYGKEATAYMKQLLQGKRVKLVSDVDSLDRFGRTLSYAYLEDGTFINAVLLKNGCAILMTIPPNVRFAEDFVALQREARRQKRGLWGNVIR